jgi:acyl carrier protein
VDRGKIASPMTEPRADILATVERLLVEVAGDELLIAGPITMTTSFNADLELESIEFVALAEKLQQHYGARVDFVGWISNKELDQIIALTVGELVEFIESARAGS